MRQENETVLDNKFHYRWMDKWIMHCEVHVTSSRKASIHSKVEGILLLVLFHVLLTHNFCRAYPFDSPVYMSVFSNKLQFTKLIWFIFEYLEEKKHSTWHVVITDKHFTMNMWIQIIKGTFLPDLVILRENFTSKDIWPVKCTNTLGIWIGKLKSVWDWNDNIKCEFLLRKQVR